MPDSGLDLTKFTKPNLQYIDLLLAPAARAEIPPDALMWDTPRWIKRILIGTTGFTDNAAATGAHEMYLPTLTMRYWIRRKEQETGLLQVATLFDNTPRDQYQTIFANLILAAVQYQNHSVVWEFEHPFVIPYRDTMFLDWTNPGIVQAGGLGAGSYYVMIHGYGASTGQHRVLSDTVVHLASAGGGAAGTAGIVPPGQNARNNSGEDIVAEKLVISFDAFVGAAVNTEALNHLRLGVRFEPSGVVLSTRIQGDLPPVLFWGSNRSIAGRLAVITPNGGPLVTSGRDTIGFEFQNNSNLGVPRTLRVQVGIVSLVEP